VSWLLPVWHLLLTVKNTMVGWVSQDTIEFVTRPGCLLVTVRTNTKRDVRIKTEKLGKAVEWLSRQPYGQSVVFRGGDDSWVRVPAHLVGRLRTGLTDHATAYARSTGSAQVVEPGTVDVAVNTKPSDTVN
jgi:hypothetical protein